MNTYRSANNPLGMTLLQMRLSIGLVGTLLPWALLAGNAAWGDGPALLASISNYYDSVMRNVFVGALFALGVFLCSYSGHDCNDRLAGLVAGLSAFGIAVCPFNSCGFAGWSDKTIQTLHLGFAIAYLVTFACYCLFLFTRTDGRRDMTPRKRVRNRWYKACGWTIVACLVLIGIYKKWLETAPGWQWLSCWCPVFWLEALAVDAFGVAWIIKSEAILGDPRG